MKNSKLRKTVLACALAAITFTQTSCMGSWKLLTGVYNWNEQATNNKFVNQLIFWAFLIVPVYEIAVLVDYVILNLIEFWTGSNPIAMAPGEVEEQKVMNDGVVYTLRATQNKFEIIAPNADKNVTMVYTPTNKTWSIEKDGSLQALTQNLSNQQVKIFFPNGRTMVFDNHQDNVAALKKSVMSYNNLASQ